MLAVLRLSAPITTWDYVAASDPVRLATMPRSGCEVQQSSRPYRTVSRLPAAPSPARLTGMSQAQWSCINIDPRAVRQGPVPPVKMPAINGHASTRRALPWESSSCKEPSASPRRRVSRGEERVCCAPPLPRESFAFA